MADTTAAPRRKGKGLKSPWVIVIVLAVAVGGGAYLLYRRSKASSSTSGSGTSGTPQTDQEDYAGQIATLQAEIADLQSSASQGGTGGGTTGGGTSGGTTGGTGGTTGTGGGSGGTTVKVTVPAVEGMTIDAAEAAIKARGLVPKLNTKTVGGTSYVIISQTPGAGKTVAKGSTVDLAAGKKGAPHLVGKK